REHRLAAVLHDVEFVCHCSLLSACVANACCIVHVMNITAQPTSVNPLAQLLLKSDLTRRIVVAHPTPKLGLDRDDDKRTDARVVLVPEVAIPRAPREAGLT